MNDQHRDEELKVEFAINSKFDGFNISKQVQFDFQESVDSYYHTNGSPNPSLRGLSSQVKIKNT
jgi:hypothetical protein